MSGSMPPEGDFSRAAVRRSRSPPDEETERKRKRKALSCYDCRRRKLKCDRQLPICGRCMKGGHPETCVYESHVAENQDDSLMSADEGERREYRSFVTANSRSSNGHTAPIVSASQEEIRLRFLLQENRIAEQEKRIEDLEKRLGGIEGPKEPPKPHSGLEQLASAARHALGSKTLPLHKNGFTKPRDNQEPMIFHGRGFKTQFWGASQPSTLLVQFPDLKSFMKEAIKHHPQVSRVSDDLRNLKDRWKGPKIPSFTFTGDHYNLLELLPGRKDVDHFMELYFSTYQNLYPIVHAPSFWREYEQFWESRQSRRPGFVTLLLLMIATVRCMSTKDSTGFLGMSSTARELAIKSIVACEAWLNHQSYKHSSLDIYQAFCILILAKIVTAYKRKMMCAAAGNVLRSGVTQGLHRDPGLLGGPRLPRKKTSVFDQELRRRLWSTILELELLTSLTRGLPPATSGFRFDTLAPSNIYDQEIERSSMQLPNSQPDDVFTSVSYLNACHRTVGLRVGLTAIINDFSQKTTYDEAMTYTDKIVEELDRLPKWRAEENVSFDLPQTLLEVQLRHFLILLHAPFIRKSQPGAQLANSIMISHDATTRILDLHSKLWSSGIYALSHLRYDVYQSTISLCYNTLTAATLQSNFLSRSMSNAFPGIIDGALIILEQQIQQVGEGYQNYWFACAASGLVLSKTSMSLEYARQHATDRMIRLYHKILNSQDRPPPQKDSMSRKSSDGGPSYPERPTRIGVELASRVQGPESAQAQNPTNIPLLQMNTADMTNQRGPPLTIPDLIQVPMPDGDPIGDVGFPDLSEWDIASFWTFDAFNTFDQWPSPDN